MLQFNFLLKNGNLWQVVKLPNLLVLTVIEKWPQKLGLGALAEARPQAGSKPLCALRSKRTSTGVSSPAASPLLMSPAQGPPLTQPHPMSPFPSTPPSGLSFFLGSWQLSLLWFAPTFHLFLLLKAYYSRP